MSFIKTIQNKFKKSRNPLAKVLEKKFSTPLVIFVNRVKSADYGGKLHDEVSKVEVEVQTVEITCLQDAVDLNKLVVRKREGMIMPKVGDIISFIEDDPIDIFKQVALGLVDRGVI